MSTPRTVRILRHSAVLLLSGAVAAVAVGALIRRSRRTTPLPEPVEVTHPYDTYPDEPYPDEPYDFIDGDSLPPLYPDDDIPEPPARPEAVRRRGDRPAPASGRGRERRGCFGLARTIAVWLGWLFFALFVTAFGVTSQLGTSTDNPPTVSVSQVRATQTARAFRATTIPVYPTAPPAPTATPTRPASPTPTVVPPTPVAYGPGKVPNVVGSGHALATASIASAGYLLVETIRYTDTVRAGTVIFQTPSAGADLPAGSVVNIVTSLGSSSLATVMPTGTYVAGPGKVPSLVGATRDEALAIIASLGYVASARSATTNSWDALRRAEGPMPWGPDRAPLVLDQSPPAFTNAPVGTAIVFTYSDK